MRYVRIARRGASRPVPPGCRKRRACGTTPILGLRIVSVRIVQVAIRGCSVTGSRGRRNQGVVRRSADQGQTYEEVLYRAVKVPQRLVGGRSATPGRFYAGLSSDDGGVTWTEAGTFGAVPLYALAYDPAAPDRVWAGLYRGGIKASEDGGQTWTDAGPTDWSINDLALGIDGANLYAATNNGVSKLALR